MFSQVVFLKHESHDYYLHFLRTCFINSLISLERVVFVKHLPYFPSLAVEHCTRVLQSVSNGPQNPFTNKS